jgi:hypothetical protein
MAERHAPSPSVRLAQIGCMPRRRPPPAPPRAPYKGPPLLVRPKSIVPRHTLALLFPVPARSPSPLCHATSLRSPFECRARPVFPLSPTAGRLLARYWPGRPPAGPAGPAGQATGRRRGDVGSGGSGLRLCEAGRLFGVCFGGRWGAKNRDGYATLCVLIGIRMWGWLCGRRGHCRHSARGREVKDGAE